MDKVTVWGINIAWVVLMIFFLGSGFWNGMLIEYQAEKIARMNLNESEITRLLMLSLRDLSSVKIGG